jgi:hypothetical protein
MIPEKSGLLRHALPNDTRTDDEADFIYQRSSEKSNPTMKNRMNTDTSRMTANPLKQQPPLPPSSQPSGLAAAMNTASKQETMMPGHRLREKASGKLEKFLIERNSIIHLGNALKKPAVQSPSTLNVKQSTNPNETDAFDTSDELLDDLVKNATLTASRDALKQRKTARYGAQRRSCMFNENKFFID